MKLVDILARELKDWPSGVENIMQTFAGMTFYQDVEGQIVPLSRFSLAEDWRSEKGVTREQWLDAVSVRNEALPTVGTVCGFCRFPNVPECEWQKVVIVAHWTEGLENPLAIFMSTSFSPQADQAVAKCFQPLLTVEQIAADEREAIIQQLEIDTDWILDRNSCEAVIAAGYRKQVQP